MVENLRQRQVGGYLRRATVWSLARKQPHFSLCNWNNFWKVYTNFSPSVHSTNIPCTILITASNGDAKRYISLALKTSDHPVKPVSEMYTPLPHPQQTKPWPGQASSGRKLIGITFVDPCCLMELLGVGGAGGTGEGVRGRKPTRQIHNSAIPNYYILINNTCQHLLFHEYC